MKKSMVFEGVAVTLLILLSFLVLAMVLGSAPEKVVSGIGDINYTFTGSDNMLYVLSGDTVHAIDGSGAHKWSFTIPGQWKVCYYGYYPGTLQSMGNPVLYYYYPIMTADNGTVYVYLRPAGGSGSARHLNGTLMAISGGREMWETPLAGHNLSSKVYVSRDRWEDTSYSDVRVDAYGDRVYVFHAYNETVISDDGSVLWSVGNVSNPAAVDERGFVYCISSTAIPAADQKPPYDVYLPDYRLPSGTVDGYYPNGTLYWETTVETPVKRAAAAGVMNILPLYNDGMVYAPMYNGITAIYANGTAKWTKPYVGSDFPFDWPFDPYNLTESQKSDIKAYNTLYEAQYAPGVVLPFADGIGLELGPYAAMPFDGEGNVYLQCKSNIPTSSLGFAGSMKMFLVTIGPDGNETSRTYLSQGTYAAAGEGVGYATRYTMQLDSGQYFGAPKPANVTDLQSDKLVAFDVKTGKELWSYPFTVNDPAVMTLDLDNVRSVVDEYEAEEAINNIGRNASEIPRSNIGPIRTWENLRVSPGKGVVYVSFQSINYEYPIVLGTSKYAYVSGIYEFGRNGTLLWHQSIPPNTMQVTPNGTIFYRTPDGRIGVTSSGIAAGFTLTALLYLFLRFLAVGAVVRAKARLNKNDNRNRVLEFIAATPGSSLYEIARGTGMNLGTVRYHLFILSLNHKVVASRTDGKYVRYFTNSGTYSKEEQLILSLMRRDAMGRVLGLMLERPGISNADIARALDIKESVVCRCTRELTERGVVTREAAGRGRSVEEAHRKHVASAMRRI